MTVAGKALDLRAPKSSVSEGYWAAKNGLPIYFRHYARADSPPRLPVVCLHGLTRNSADFEDIAADLAQAGHNVIVPDMRGRGRSGYDPEPMNYVPRVYARDVIGLLRDLGVGRAIFLGTSMGGLITMVTAWYQPRLVAAVVLNDIGPEVAPEGLARIAGYAGKPVEVSDWQDAAAYVEAVNGVAFPDASADDWARFARRTFRDGPSAGLGDPRPVLAYDPRIRDPIMAGKAKAPNWLAWLMFRRTARRRPLLVLRGELSDLLTRDIASRMKRAAPQMKLVEVSRVGHAPMLNESQAREAIIDFTTSLG